MNTSNFLIKQNTWGRERRRWKWSKAISIKFWSNHFCVWPCPLLWEVLSSPARSCPVSPSCFANWSSHWSSSCRQINLITNTVWAKSFKINPLRHNSLLTLSSCALVLCEWHLPPCSKTGQDWHIRLAHISTKLIQRYKEHFGSHASTLQKPSVNGCHYLK